MTKIDDQIADIQKKMEQHRNRLKNLKAEATKQERKDELRKKIIYGAAYLAALSSLSDNAQKRSLERVEERITRPKDREFLGLLPLENRELKPSKTEATEGPTTQELPFEKF